MRLSYCNYRTLRRRRPHARFEEIRQGNHVHDDDREARRRPRFPRCNRSGHRFEAGTGPQAWLLQARKAALLSREQEVDLARRIESARARQDWREERRVKEQLIAANLRLVANIAGKYRDRGMLIEDLMQEGTIGLMRAVEGFDWRKGFRFSTFAVWWIRQTI